MLRGSSTLSKSSGLADDRALYTKGPDAIPAMTIMVQEAGGGREADERVLHRKGPNAISALTIMVQEVDYYGSGDRAVG
jgi:hypothetical protein